MRASSTSFVQFAPLVTVSNLGARGNPIPVVVLYLPTYLPVCVRATISCECAERCRLSSWLVHTSSSAAHDLRFSVRRDRIGHGAPSANLLDESRITSAHCSGLRCFARGPLPDKTWFDVRLAFEDAVLPPTLELETRT